MIRILIILAALLEGVAHAAPQATAPMRFVAGVGEISCGPVPSVIGQYDGETTASCKAASFTTVAEDLQLECDMSDDETATLRSAIEGGDAAGTSTFVRSGCRILLGTPGAGDSVAAFPSNTTIYCEDKTAGFVLATKHCSGASDAPGAACTADNQCNNGTCAADADAGTAFAPTEGSTYTGFSAATGAKDIAIINCSIWAQGASGSPAALGGADKQWGYCNGAGTSVAGEACAKVCDATASPSILEGLACTSDTGCGSVAGSCDVIAGDCTTLGGACGAVPYATNFAPVGPGKVNPIDFSAATNARIENVTVYDHRRGDFTFRTGVAGAVVDSQTDGRTLVVPIAGASLLNFAINASVSKGIIAGAGLGSLPGTSVTRSRGTGWDAGIHALGANYLVGAEGGFLGTSAETGWDGSINLLISGAGVIAHGFRGNGGLYCVAPTHEEHPDGVGYNFIVANAFCDGHIGPKFIVQAAGNQYLGIRGAWHGRGSIVGLSDQRGRCSAGDRSGKVCVFGSGSDSTIGCNGGTCTADDDFPANGATHFVIGAGTLLHTNQTGGAHIRATDSKRCATGDEIGAPCSVDGDCAGSGACRPLRYNAALISGVNDYFGMGNTAIDLDTSAIGVVQDATVGGPSIENWLIDGILFDRFATGIKFPANNRVCVGGASAGTSCDEASDCSGGSCESPVKHFVASGNMAGVTTPLVNWDGGYGDVSGLKGLLVTDDQGTVVTYTAGEALTEGQLVKLSTTANQVVRVATSDTGEQAVGVAQHTALSGFPVKVTRLGTASCISDTGTVAAGDLLERGTTTDGRVQTSNSTADVIVGAAMEADGASGSTFLCAVRPPGVQSATASPFQTATLTSDAATQTSDTVVATEFTFTLSANKSYILDGFLIVTGGATGDMRCNLDGPSGVTVTHAYASSGTDLVVTGDNTDGKCVEIIGGTDNVIAVGGSIINSTNAGSLAWKWAQNTSNGTGTTVKAGSWMRIMER